MLDIVRNNIKQRLQEQGRSLIHSMLGRWQTPGGGVLAQSLEVMVGAESLQMAIGAGLEYTHAVFSGAGRHKIEGKGDYPLHWNRFGRDFYFWSVMHPGQKSRSDILLALMDLARRISEEEVRAVLTAFAIPGGS
jgi:hypothetical protein